MSGISSKQGQPSSYSPRTLENSRRRLGNFLTNIASLGSPLASSRRTAPTEVEGSPSKSRIYSNAHATKREDDCLDLDGLVLGTGNARRDIGVDSGVEISDAAGLQRIGLMDLPDDILTLIFHHLRPTLRDLCTLSLVSNGFRELAQSPTIWAELYLTTPGYRLTVAGMQRGAAASAPPPGRWDGLEWVSEEQPLAMDGLKLNCEQTAMDPIPIHYPTLYRARHALSRYIREPSPRHRTKTETLAGHSDSVYCVQPAGRWIFTGSRDRSIRIWLLGGYDQAGEARATTLVKDIPEAHTGSVLCLTVDLDEDGKGVMITGSSDLTARLWRIDLSNMDQPTAEPEVTMTGHELGVLGVALTPRHIVTCSKDCTIRVYDRTSHALRHVLTGHERAVNALAASPDEEVIVSASGDGTWRIWNLDTGTWIRQGGQKGGSGLACIAWQDDYLITGDNASERSVKMYRASTGVPLRSCSGHTGLIRAVSLDVAEGLVASGSYDAAIRIWDLHTGQILRKFTNGSPGLVFDVQMSFNRLFIARNDGNAEVISLVTGLPYLDAMA